MGNTHGSKRVHASRQVVTVLTANGESIEFNHPVRVSDLIYDYPNHFVCHSSGLVLQQHGKMLPPTTFLLRGEMYFLLPLPGKVSSSPAAVPSIVDSLRAPLLAPADPPPPPQVSNGGKTLKFVITKQQLAKILADGTIKVAEGCSLENLNLPVKSYKKELDNATPPVKRNVTWSPVLDSISEVAAK